MFSQFKSWYYYLYVWLVFSEVHTDRHIECDLCSLKFHTKDRLTVHMRTHTGKNYWLVLIKLDFTFIMLRKVKTPSTLNLNFVSILQVKSCLVAPTVKWSMLKKMIWVNTSRLISECATTAKWNFDII